jgi:hypothetical protein
VGVLRQRRLLDRAARRSRAPRLASVWLSLCGALACSAEAPPQGDSACTLRAALVGGSAEESYLGLTREQQNAVLQLRFFRENGTLLDACSGVLFAPGRVLTARHCMHGETPARVELRFGADAAVADHVLSALETSEHPELDLAIVSFEADSLPADYARAISAAPDGLPSSLVDHVAVLAGYGLSEAALSEGRRFAAEPITALEPDSVVVSGGDVSGACLGDSGGPLLGRGVDGLVRVYGVLSAGSVTCRGDDRYTRLDVDPDWASGVGLLGQRNEVVACDGVNAEGRCFGEVAVWCEADELQRAECAAPAACGWDEVARGYRCRDSAGDPCRGVPDSGTCEGARARVCSSGSLLEVDCEACADTCMLSPATGRVACAIVEPSASTSD